MNLPVEWRRSVLWDSSAILAVLDDDDTQHGSAMTVVAQLIRSCRSAVVTNYIEAEAHALLLRRLGRGIAHHWLFQHRFNVVTALASDEKAAREMLTRYADKDWSLCDAISFAVMESHGIGAAFSFDHHFAQFGRVPILGPA